MRALGDLAKGGSPRTGERRGVPADPLSGSAMNGRSATSQASVSWLLFRDTSTMAALHAANGASIKFDT